MKRILAAVIAIALLSVIPIVTAVAAGSTEKGDMLITQDPEKKQGEVGEIVKVDFYLYPNLPDGRKLDSLSGTMQFDPAFLTLGAINQVDEENNLTSLMKGKASSFQYKVDETGTLRFAFIDAYGVSASGFWFQAEFRIEQEGATDFLFNGITYTGIDSEFKAITFMIDPISVGGVYTEGQAVPTDGAADETFAPLTPAILTPAPVTPTPRPSNTVKPVPVTSTLPTYSMKPTASGVVTLPPAVTSMPIVTAAPRTDAPAQNETPVPGTSEPVLPVGDTTPDPQVPASADPDPLAENTAFPISGDVESEATKAPETENDPKTQPAPEPADKSAEEKDDNTDLWLIIGIAGGMVAVLGLGALAIVLLLKRRKMNEQD